MMTKNGNELNGVLLIRYFDTLVNMFFKILPIKESGETSITTYVESLQAELMGCNELICAVHDDPMLLTLLSILQYFIDHPDCDVRVVKREVFKSISICNKLKAKYSDLLGGDAE